MNIYLFTESSMYAFKNFLCPAGTSESLQSPVWAGGHGGTDEGVGARAV